MGRKMKKLLVLVLLALWMAADAGAVSKCDVFVYSFIQKSTDFACDINGVSDMNDTSSRLWNKSIETSVGYLFVQWNSPTSLSVWTVTMEKRKELGQDGKLHKCVLFTSRPTEYSIAQAGLGRKTTWLLSVDSDWEHLFLTGDERPVKISGEPGDIATKLAGTRTWNYVNGDILHVGSATMVLRWQSKLTAQYDSNPDLHDGWEATEWFLLDLDSKGYYIDDP
jgi:hypothetical protein